VSKNKIVCVEISHCQKWMLVLDSEGNLSQYNEERFCNKNSSIKDTFYYLATPLIDYHSSSRDMNFLTSVMLYHIGNYDVDPVREFFKSYSNEIMKIYSQAKQISSNDIIVMMYALHLSGLDSRVRSFLDAIKSNSNVERKDLTHLVKYIFNQ